jgi:phosphatidate cytidylyltransferase
VAVTRLVSGLALFVLAVALVWFAPSWLFLVGALGLVVAACAEYAALARHNGVAVSGVVGGLAALITSASFSGLVDDRVLDAILMTAFLATAVVALSRWRGQHDVLSAASAELLPVFYIALPVGAMITLREERGREALALLMLTIIVSDTAQFYTGRLFGRRLLAPRISPKKTIAGACGGFAAGIVLLAVVGAMWLPAVPLWQRIALGAAVVAFGIAGDLFESMLKRSAGLKDSSGIIPGHGGVLDRIDALLFAAPVFYIVLRYL